MKKNAFTLLELLVVIVILGVLVTLGSRGLRSARINAKKAMARVDIQSIETALKAYHNIYARLPSSSFAEDLNASFDDLEPDHASSAEIIAALAMNESAEEELNPKRVVFLETPASDDGAFRDPWGYQYRIALDTNYDGEIMIGDQTIRRKVAVFSVGFFAETDGENPEEVITSW